MGDGRSLEIKITEILSLFEISEILEMCDITEEETLEILVKGGHIELPPFIEGPDEHEYGLEYCEDEDQAKKPEKA